MGAMRDSFLRAFGTIFGLNDVAPRVYQQGWNDALAEMSKRVNEMPFGDDTKASFGVFFVQQMEVLDGYVRTDQQEDK
jgi:hypothetical protein